MEYIESTSQNTFYPFQNKHQNHQHIQSVRMLCALKNKNLVSYEMGQGNQRPQISTNYAHSIYSISLLQTPEPYVGRVIRVLSLKIRRRSGLKFLRPILLANFIQGLKIFIRLLLLLRNLKLRSGEIFAIDEKRLSVDVVVAVGGQPSVLGFFSFSFSSSVVNVIKL